MPTPQDTPQRVHIKRTLRPLARLSMIFAMWGCLRGFAHLGWMVLQHPARCAHVRYAHCASPGTLRQRGYIDELTHAVANLALGTAKLGHALL